MTDTFISSLFLREESLDNDSCLPIYKTIPVISNTPRQTHSVRNYIFLHFVMVITVLWAELWFVVARCNLAVSVGIVPTIIHDNLVTTVIDLGDIMSWMIA
jgi:hypothetical protein